eukprot:scaffold59921_cov50-Phaeocystis_antarctica.AAC.2
MATAAAATETAVAGWATAVAVTATAMAALRKESDQQQPPNSCPRGSAEPRSQHRTERGTARLRPCRVSLGLRGPRGAHGSDADGSRVQRLKTQMCRGYRGAGVKGGVGRVQSCLRRRDFGDLDSHRVGLAVT